HHLAGNGPGNPSLRFRAQHHGLRIEPPPLVQQPSETAAIVAVLFDGVLVVGAGNEPLVGDKQQRKAWRLVNAAALRFDDPILDLVAHSEAMAPANPVRLEDQLDWIAE